MATFSAIAAANPFILLSAFLAPPHCLAHLVQVSLTCTNHSPLPHVSTPLPLRVPTGLAQLLQTPFDTRQGISRALDRYLINSNMALPAQPGGKPVKYILGAPIAQFMGRMPGTEVNREDLMQVCEGRSGLGGQLGTPYHAV